MEVLDWDRLAYGEALERQRARQQARQQGRVEDALIFVEHPTVYTLGMRQGAREHLLASAGRLAELGVDVVQTERGGDVTCHLPGQLVGYPIVSLERRRDLHAWLRLLEETLIRTLGCLGVAAHRREGYTGIWLEQRKIAAIGVAVRRWVTFHGFALNVSNDLAPFDAIVPCGITPEQGRVTTLSRELGRDVDLADVKPVLALEFERLLREYFTD
ncbi:MAG: lipoyl(octanoyl) transferase LipB [Opitutales bacterium]